MPKQPEDAYYAAPTPPPEGSLLEYFEALAQPPHLNEPVNPVSIAESVRAWNEGREEELAQMDADESRRKAEISRNLSQAQRGKHTALQDNGFYSTGSNLKPGMFLPNGFGPVTHSNHERADAHARELNRQIHRERGDN